jgi:acetoacetyl-CoA reductase
VTREVGPVDVLVNAGITRDMTFKKMTKADWDAVMPPTSIRSST